MPLSSLQADILTLLAGNRSPTSFVAGGVPLNVRSVRTSQDIDIFHDHSAALAEAAKRDAEVLVTHGYAVEWETELTAIHTAKISLGGASTKLDWVVDSDFRFFPPVRHSTFGYVLHPIDIATNKALAAASRKVPRDAVDLVTIHEQFYPLGAVIWAAVGKDPGWSPEHLIEEIRRNARYQDYDLENLDLSSPITAAELSQKLRAALKDAETFVERMPSEFAGVVFRDSDGQIVQPDPSRLDGYARHTGSRGGHWPSSPDISSEMLKTWPGDTDSEEAR